MVNSTLYNLFLSHPVITTDSRDCPAGSIFFALKGETFNGNAYAEAALQKGCAYAVVDEPQYCISDDERYILVPDVLTALQDLAREHRRALGTTIIGITGTNGKTTTKELIAAVLQKKYNVLYTQGNFNNHIGVPKTLLRLTKEHEIAVIEMGANHPGEIKTLVDIVEPDYGLITNVGQAHLEGFGSFEGVKKTKGELYDYLIAHDGRIFIDADNPHLMEMLRTRTAATKNNGEANGQRSMVNGQRSMVNGQRSMVNVQRSMVNGQRSTLAKATMRNMPTLPLRGGIMTQGALRGSAKPMVNGQWSMVNGQYLKGETVSCSPFLRFRWDGGEVQTQLIGTYNLINMMAAATVGRHFGVSDEQISDALSHYTPSNNRSQLTVTEKNKLIVDTYNANPTSMMAALENFTVLTRSLPEGTAAMVILGDMRELGEVSAREHQRVVDYIKTHQDPQKPWIVWLVGSEFQKTDNPFRTFPDVSAVKAALAEEGTPEGKYILIKGSNGIRLFDLPEEL